MSASTEVRVGQLVRDAHTEREGVVMAMPGTYGARFWLRPEGGGLEWEVLPEFVQTLGDKTASESA